MLKLIVHLVKQYYLWGSLLVLFFFLRGGQFLLKNVSANWGYIFDQLGLAVVGGILAFIWLKKKKYLRLGWIISLLIFLFVILTHYHSFYRPFFFDELRNIISPLSVLHGYHGDPFSVAAGFAERAGIRERYGWSITAIIYELVGINRPNFLFFYTTSNILLMVAASLSVAYLTLLMSKSKLAAIIAALLVGINPNSFISLLRLTNIQTDTLGAMLVTFTIAVWFVARKTNDKKGIFIALILLAATLKGGSVVRTAFTGGLIILTDIIFFKALMKKRAWFDWCKVLLVSTTFYLFNNAIHIQSSSAPSSATMNFLTRLSFIADATTRSLIDPILLTFLMHHLKKISGEITLTVVIGIILFLLGTAISIFTLLKRKYTYFAWGWSWFYICILFFPWLAELHNKPIDDVFDLNSAGFNYGYLSLIGIYIAVGIFLSTLRKKGVVGLLFALLAFGILTYRTYEFVKLDYNWRVDYSNRVGDWYNLVFGMFPAPTGLKTPSKNPSVLVELDKDHIGMEAELFIPLIYHDGSLLFYHDLNLFYKEVLIDKKIPPERIYAVAWDEKKKQIFNLTPEFRRLLSKQEIDQREIIDFTKKQDL